MGKQKSFKKQIKELIELVKDYKTLGQLLSDNDGVAAMAKVNQGLHKILLNIKMGKATKVKHPESKAVLETKNTGRFVKVAPCGKEYEGKNFIGIMIGDVSLGSSVKLDEGTITCEFAGHNPAILIPDIGKVIYGMESFWGYINLESDLEDIDVENVWYVKALRDLQEKKAKKDSEDDVG